jgi:hypothetical protein
MGDVRCLLCGKDAKPARSHPRYHGPQIRGFLCERCGEYYVTRVAASDIEAYPAHKKAKVSAVTREHSELGRPIAILSSGHKPSGEDDIGIAID